jgi:hypothetical protein
MLTSKSKMLGGILTKLLVLLVGGGVALAVLAPNEFAQLLAEFSSEPYNRNSEMVSVASSRSESLGHASNGRSSVGPNPNNEFSNSQLSSIDTLKNERDDAYEEFLAAKRRSGHSDSECAWGNSTSEMCYWYQRYLSAQSEIDRWRQRSNN